MPWSAVGESPPSRRATRAALTRVVTTVVLLSALVGVGRVPAASATTIGADPDPFRGIQWSLDLLSAEDVWERQTADGVVVAVVDTGVDASHPDLDGVVLDGIDLLDPGTRGRVDPGDHGTGVASIIAARVQNGVGGAGLAPGVRILPVRALDAARTGSPGDIAEGIGWAVDAGADVINLSLGSTTSFQEVDDAIERALRRGVVVVAASGNSGSSGGEPVYPGAGDLPTSTGAIDDMLEVAGFSTVDPSVDLAAPGVDVLVAASGGSYLQVSGTSYAAPHVSAAAALLIARYPRSTPAQTVRRLVSTALDIGPAGVDPASGAGVIQPLAALDADAELGCQERVEPLDTLTRSFDLDRIGTAAAVACSHWPTGEAAGSPTSVVLARADAYPDALAGAPLAARRDAPLMLVDPAAVPTELYAVLDQLGVQEAVVLGGSSAIDPDVVTALERFGLDVERLSGADRASTAAAVATAVAQGSAPARVLVVNGTRFPDAVAAGAYQSGPQPTPVLLVERDRVPDATAAALTALDPDEVVVVGGPAAVSTGVGDALDALTDATVRRVAGEDRYATSAAVLGDADVDASAPLVLATGGAFPDALAAGALTARLGGGLLLVNPVDTTVTATAIAPRAPGRGVLVGGPAAVSEESAEILRLALEGS